MSSLPQDHITVCFAHNDALDVFKGANGARFGGAETQVYLLIRTLAADPGYEPWLIVEQEVSEAHYPGVKFIRQRSAIQRGVPYLSRFVNRWRATRPYRGLSDAILLQTIASYRTIDVWETARRLGFKFVPRMSCDADTDGSLLPPDMRDRYFAALHDADGVISHSRAQQEQLRSSHDIESCLVPNMVVPAEEGPHQGGSHVLWVGRGAAIKRPWIFVETARVMPEYEFVMVMPQEDPLFWRWVAQEAEHIPNLTIIPGASYFEMDRYFREAALLLGTSAIEGFPNVYLQAAAQGTPVVSLDVDPSGLDESGGCGLYAHGDIGKFRGMVAALMSEPADLAALGTRAYEYVKRYHNPEVVGPVFKEFLRTVAGR